MTNHTDLDLSILSILSKAKRRLTGSEIAVKLPYSHVDVIMRLWSLCVERKVAYSQVDEGLIVWQLRKKKK